MSNIFYTQVDKHLQEELNARGRSGFSDRSTNSLNFMLGKIANVQLTAYEGNDSKSKVVREYGVLGGLQLQAGRYMPNGMDGFLNEQTYTRESINFYKETDVNTKNPALIPGNAYTSTTTLTDKSRRTGPFVTGVDIAIGDHSMGLLNKATIQFVIPNPTRDLDGMEDTWFRPGRYVKIEVEHPQSALITKTKNGGLLTSGSLPNKDRLKKLYPTWDIDDLLNTIAQMNVFTFEGLITSFEFSYTSDATIDASISLTGTSNVYTDVSMYLETPTSDPKTPNPKTTIQVNSTFEPVIPTLPVAPGHTTTPTGSVPQRVELYEKLYNRVETIIETFKQSPGNDVLTQFLLPFTIEDNVVAEATDHFILRGSQFLPKLQEQDIPQSTATFIYDPSGSRWNSRTKKVDPITEAEQRDKFNKTQFELSSSRAKHIADYNAMAESSEPSRYITMGGLIHFINTYVVTKVTGSAKQAEIIHTDAACFSNYYPSLVSTMPQDVLFLPKESNPQKSGDMTSVLANYDMNSYGSTLTFYKDITSTMNSVYENNTNALGNRPWTGVYEGTEKSGVMYPSRIFINLEMIQDILNTISEGNTKKFTLKTFIVTVCAKISQASSNAISLKLVTHPEFQDKLYLTDAKYLKQTEKDKVVLPYSVPMFANHENGSIVREFSFAAKLPESVKNLSYVLNSGDDVTEEQIAPYMNFMYNSKNPDKINEMLADYKSKHIKILKNLATAKSKYGEAPGIPELQQALYKALSDYIKYPTDDIRKSQQITAPIFPFDVEITIDGINGLRYGDILQFEALPTKYRVNTVFSIININHTISANGEWTTKLRCIMRPSID
jgi:hypothetical protein